MQTELRLLFDLIGINCVTFNGECTGEFSLFAPTPGVRSCKSANDAGNDRFTCYERYPATTAHLRTGFRGKHAEIVILGSAHSCYRCSEATADGHRR